MPAMEDHEGNGAPVKSERGEAGNAAYPELDCSNGLVNKVHEVVAELWVWCSRLRCCDARASSVEQCRRRWRLGPPRGVNERERRAN
jgi:hypothetical protein